MAYHLVVMASDDQQLEPAVPSDDQELEPLFASDLEDIDAHSLAICRAMSHADRAAILTLLTESGKSMSPNELHKLVGVTIGDASYHCKMLVKYGCAQEVATRPRRGATEHFYQASRSPNISTPVWKRLPPPVRDALSRYAFEMIEADALAAFKEQTMDARSDRFMARIPMSVDEQAWSEIYGILNGAFSEILEIKARSENRLREDRSEAFRISASLLCFEVP